MTTSGENPKKIKGLKKYRETYKRAGFKGLIKEEGWKVAVLLFLFFLGKGLLWLAFFYGGFELLEKLFN